MVGHELLLDALSTAVRAVADGYSASHMAKAIATAQMDALAKLPPVPHWECESPEQAVLLNQLARDLKSASVAQQEDMAAAHAGFDTAQFEWEQAVAEYRKWIADADRLVQVAVDSAMAAADAGNGPAADRAAAVRVAVAAAVRVGAESWGAAGATLAAAAGERMAAYSMLVAGASSAQAKMLAAHASAHATFWHAMTAPTD